MSREQPHCILLRSKVDDPVSECYLDKGALVYASTDTPNHRSFADIVKLSLGGEIILCGHRTGEPSGSAWYRAKYRAVSCSVQFGIQFLSVTSAISSDIVLGTCQYRARYRARYIFWIINGSRLSLWWDPWCNGKSLVVLYYASIASLPSNSSVAAIVSEGAWSFPHSLPSHLHYTIHAIPLSNVGCDSPMWSNMENPTFEYFMKDFYNNYDEVLPPQLRLSPLTPEVKPLCPICVASPRLSLPPSPSFSLGTIPCSSNSSVSVLLLHLRGAFDSVQAATSAHPWPEWGQFVEKIRSKDCPFRGSDDEGEALTVSRTPALGDEGIALDINRLKNACLKSLPKEDIRAIVECGCPNIFRKSVNSAKRLRAFLRLDEADVCCACNLRASCDRAYKIVHEEEGARTVDIMRVLLSYAVNPAALLGGENSPVKVQVQDSACKLLSEFI
ncbi:hypothetical protein IEQ34_019505 [Dendrobium chrysotoxum]|uniref:Uncharacterized protein n=1 Tax=Dendrobium chrysotoxum TaxID=161865 RepID=A0AAV7G715_DENCH|nr:hypothetical protein IEQ34_019505 [Dendrobium chrysotoxum]